MTSIELNCIFYTTRACIGDIFTVPVALTDTVEDLKGKMMDEVPTKFAAMYAAGFRPYALQNPIPLSQKHFGQALADFKAGIVENDTAFKPMTFPRKVIEFPELHSPVFSFLHIIMMPLDDIDELPDKLAELSLHERESIHRRKLMKQISGLKSPREVARCPPSQLGIATQIIQNHRNHRHDVPLDLMEVIFAEFSDEYKTAQPTWEDALFINALAETACLFFPDESERQDYMQPLFDRYFGFSSRYGMVKEYGVDSAYAREHFIFAFYTYKSEVGKNGDPEIENAMYYAHYVEEIHRFHNGACRLPAFLIQVYGCHVSIAMAAFGQSIVVDSFIDINFARSPADMMDTARVFVALKTALNKLDQYYTALKRESPEQRKYPRYNSFNSLEAASKSVQFSYEASLGHIGSLVYTVRCSIEHLPSTLIVKFVRCYPKETHLLCSKLGIAPNLYGFRQLPGGWFMVVMEHMANYTLLSEIEDPPAEIIEQIKVAARTMHDAGIVHGDLLPFNICVSKDPSSERPIVFIDWDWSGEAGQVIYPLWLNPITARPPSVEGGMPILVEHDKLMVRGLEEKDLWENRWDLHRKWFKDLDYFRMMEEPISL